MGSFRIMCGTSRAPLCAVIKQAPLPSLGNREVRFQLPPMDEFYFKWLSDHDIVCVELFERWERR